jgi:CheY-like chemotaxis protein
MVHSSVLYVEDEGDDAFFMQAAFKRTGLSESLYVVSDGCQALAYLAGEGPYTDRARHPLPGLVLLDLNLPLISGFDVLAWIRQQPQFQATPVVIFSSSGRPEDKERATQLGASQYVQKPASGMQFTEVARDLAQRWLGQGHR